MNRNARTMTAALALLAVAGLAACGGGGGDGTTKTASAPRARPASGVERAPIASALPDACTLLDAAELATLLGPSVSGPSAAIDTDPEHTTACDWDNSAEPGITSLGLVQLYVFDSPKFLPRDAFGGEPTADATVPGADEAFTVVHGRGLELNMVVDGKRVSLTLSPSTGTGTDRADDILAVGASL